MVQKGFDHVGCGLGGGDRDGSNGLVVGRATEGKRGRALGWSFRLVGEQALQRLLLIDGGVLVAAELRLRSPRSQAWNLVMAKQTEHG